MQHLVREMSVENLAFIYILEVFQLKQKYFNDPAYRNGVGEFIKLPSDLPVHIDLDAMICIERS